MQIFFVVYVKYMITKSCLILSVSTLGTGTSLCEPKSTNQEQLKTHDIQKYSKKLSWILGELLVGSVPNYTMIIHLII